MWVSPLTSGNTPPPLVNSYLAFDLRRNAGRMTEHSGLAAQFLAAARWVREQGFSRVFVDNLFSATELMAKGLLIWLPDRSVMGSKTHRSIKVRFNALRRCDGTTTSMAGSSTS